MKLAGIWTLYDNEELLSGSINQIKDHLDGVFIIHQNESNFGNYYDGYYNWTRKIPHESIPYAPISSPNSHNNQQRKLSQALRYARNEGYTHYIYLAPDEYYDTSQFAKCKEIAKEFDSTVCRIYTYIKWPTHRLIPEEDYYVPFISRIYPGQSFSQKDYPVLVDPSRCLVPAGKFYEFKKEELMMHHYSWVRQNLKRKLENHSLAKRYDVNKLLEDFHKWNGEGEIPFFKDFGIQEVENFFEI